jgi:hypothetical protein
MIGLPITGASDSGARKGEVQAAWNLFDSKESAEQFVRDTMNGGFALVAVIPVPPDPKDWADTVRKNKAGIPEKTGGLHITGMVNPLRIPLGNNDAVEASPARGNFYVGFRKCA